MQVKRYFKSLRLIAFKMLGELKNSHQTYYRTTLFCCLFSKFMKIKNSLAILIGFLATSLIQYPVFSQYRFSKVPYQPVYLSSFTSAVNSLGFQYGNYSRLPYCFGTSETVNGITPVVVICPLATSSRDSGYTTNMNGGVSTIWISILITSNSSRTTTYNAVKKAGLVARVFANVRYNVTQDSMADVIVDEFDKTINNINTYEYRDDTGAYCRLRERKLLNVGDFETRACSTNKIINITFWF